MSTRNPLHGIKESIGFAIDISPSLDKNRFILLGIGGGIFNAPTTSLLMGAAPKNMLGSVAALANTMRLIAMSSGVAIAGVIFSTRQSFHFSRLTTQNFDPAVLNQLSVIGGYRDTIILGAAVCFIGIFTSAFIGRKKKVLA